MSNFQAARFFDFAHYVDVKPMVKNLNIFDFTLTDEDMAQIATMNQHDTGTVNFQDPQFVKYLIQVSQVL